MWRGTTPTHVFTVPSDVPLQNFTTMYMTYSQNGKVVVEKKESDLTVDTANHKIRLTFTQADSLRFQPGSVQIQLRAKTAQGDAVASNIITTTAADVLKDGEI